MRAGRFTRSVLAVAIAFSAGLTVVQAQGPILFPGKSKPTATLLVTCDLACDWSLDGDAKGHIAAGGMAKTPISLGQHLLDAATPDGLDKLRKAVDIQDSKQVMVGLELAPVRDARLKSQPASAPDAVKPPASDPAKARDRATELYSEGRALTDLAHYDDAKPLFQKACDTGELRGCTGLADLYSNGLGVPQDYGQARALFQKACDGKEMGGCRGLGTLYLSGYGVAQDSTQARALFQKSCDGGDMEVCWYLGYIYQTGLATAKDMALGDTFYKKACAGGLAVACPNTQDSSDLRVFELNACNEGVLEGCTGLGGHYYLAINNNPNGPDPAIATKSLDFYKKACNGGDLRGCQGAGTVADSGWTGTKDPNLARADFQKACDGGLMASCDSLGAMYENGDGVPKDQAQAILFYQRARNSDQKDCDAGDSTECDILGSLYELGGRGVRKDQAQADLLHQKAIDGYQKGCNAGDLDQCVSAANLFYHTGFNDYMKHFATHQLLTGTGNIKGFTQALPLYQKACDGGNMQGCAGLGDLYAQGYGVHKDKKLALSLYQKACNGGDQYACGDHPYLD